MKNTNRVAQLIGMRARLYDLKLRSKRGETLTSEEFKFVRMMFRKYEGVFDEVEAEVNDTIMSEVNPLWKRGRP